MGRSDEQDGSVARDLPGTSRHNLSEKEVDQVAHDIQEQVILPVHHGVELFLRGRIRLRLRRRSVLCAGLGGHGEPVGDASQWFRRGRIARQGRTGAGSGMMA